MPQVKCIPPTLTDNVTLFQDVASANTFFGNFVIPQAGPSQGGTVIQGTTVAYVNGTVTPDFFQLQAVQADGSTVINNLATDSAFNSMQAKVDATATALLALINSLKVSGAIATS